MPSCRHPSDRSAGAKVPRCGTDGVQGQSPATLTLLAKSSVLHLLRRLGCLRSKQHRWGGFAAAPEGRTRSGRCMENPHIDERTD